MKPNDISPNKRFPADQFYPCEITGYRLDRGVELGGGITWKPWRFGREVYTIMDEAITAATEASKKDKRHAYRVVAIVQEPIFKELHGEAK